MPSVWLLFPVEYDISVLPKELAYAYVLIRQRKSAVEMAFVILGLMIIIISGEFLKSNGEVLGEDLDSSLRSE
jgi:hypothetical protein